MPTYWSDAQMAISQCAKPERCNGLSFLIVATFEKSAPGTHAPLVWARDLSTHKKSAGSSAKLTSHA